MSGRYQSKVFNYVSRQSMRLRDRSAQTWRQAKIGLVWTVQVLLYPVYAAFQATRLVDKILGQAIRRTLPQLQASPEPASDQPIRAALRELSSLEVRLSAAPTGLPAVLTHARQQPARADLAEVLVTTPGLSAAVQIRGLASVLGTGHLALVTTQNQVLDILTPDQQSQLSQRLVWELANYWYEQQHGSSLPHPQPSSFLPLPHPRPNALPPIRVFRRLMAWMQRGSVAATADLFQESQLVLASQPDWTVAETEFYGWLSQTGQAAGRLVRASWEAGKAGLSKRSLEAAIQTFQTVQMALPPTPMGIPAPLPASRMPADWMILLDHWLSEIPGLKADPVTLAGWNDGEDLSDLYVPDLEPLLPSSAGSTLPPSWQQGPLGQLESRAQSQIGQMRTGPNLRAHQSEQAAVWEITDTAAIESSLKGQSQLGQPQPDQPNPTAAKRSALDEWDADLGLERLRRRRPTYDAPLTSLDTANEEEAAMLPNHWIETEAQIVGYEKHPLEQLLEWLDKGMVWIESKLAKLWQWLNRPLG